MKPLRQTLFYDRHVSLGAQMVDFGGWRMPVQYPSGIVQEHLTCRKHAGLFDVSHMGRFLIGGTGAPAFLQHVLTNNSAGLRELEGQYTLIANDRGGAVDDAYLYRLAPEQYLLVVNAANRDKDWSHLQSVLTGFKDVRLADHTEKLAMVSFQGPESRAILSGLLDSGILPEPLKNEMCRVVIGGASVILARTGYTGDPIGFELFVDQAAAPAVWDLLKDKGVQPIGLGARDTLRLEAGLPLYGHELGRDPEGGEIPIFAIPLARFAVSFSPLKGSFIGRPALEKQYRALKKIMNWEYSLMADLPRRVVPLALIDKGVARGESKVFRGESLVGYVTSGTMVPYWKTDGEGVASRLTGEKGRRAIALALLDSDLHEGDGVEIEIRGKRCRAVIVPYHLRSEAPPFARAVTVDRLYPEKTPAGRNKAVQKLRHLVTLASANTTWRQRACMNLIPSEQTPSKLVKLLSITDPAGRYAEHKQMKAFFEDEVFYYQGTDFIARVEEKLNQELCRFLGCREVESRMLSGQMANTAVFSALVDYLNRTDRKQEPTRIPRVLNHHIIKGGHLSAQPMGALRDFVARDPDTEKPAVENFPVLAENPYQIDLPACKEVIAEYRPALIIFGKSMTLHREPVAPIRAFVDELGLDCTLMYDMAHVLGLVGPHFQQPFNEGADIVTGSTHKTFFGTQRGIIGMDVERLALRYPLWEAIQRRAFPGSVSNHHLGTMLGLLAAVYEMNFFKDDYQKQVIINAKAFARALKSCGLDVAGDPAISHTETHQVIFNVGYAKGPEIARRLEENNIIVNYQAAPREEGFTASGALRLGVSEMTRFGMAAADFETLAQLLHDVIVHRKQVKEAVVELRKRFLEMQFCFSGRAFDGLAEELYGLI